MKKFVLAVISALMTISVASAQKICVVDSEKIFKSLSEYNKAMSTLDELGKEYQTEVDAKYKAVENLYNSYMAQKDNLPASTRATVERQILQKEEEAKSFQQEAFGEGGTLMKRRMELIKPIQDKVFAAIDKYAKANGFDVVLDKASNASLLYYNGAIDGTAQVIELLK